VNRTNVLNLLATKLAAKRYLEIGVRNPADNFYKVNVEQRVGVDPNVSAEGVLRVTSDDYFRDVVGRFDLIFVDGDHGYEQSMRDVANALRHLTRGGAVVLHDCSPRSAAAAVPVKPPGGLPWNGEVWRTYCELRTRKDLCCFCVDCDHGMGVVRRGRTASPLLSPPETWSDLDRDRVRVLNLVSPEKFVAMLEEGEV
jgi:hypothetical protein